MTSEETPQSATKRIVIDPISRVEGHGKVTLLVDDNDQVQQARLHIVEFRGFEKFIQGRPYWELPLVVQRLCGICPVSHHLAAAKAIDQIAGVDALTAPAEKLRRAMHLGQTLQSHALHFFHLASPDLLFGFDSEISRRNIVGVIQEHPTIAMEGIRIRKFGQQVIEAISGKRIHGIAAIPGGMNRALKKEQVAQLKTDIKPVIEWCKNAVALAKKLFKTNIDYHREFGRFDSSFMSLVGKAGELDLYHGAIRVKDKKGDLLFPDRDYCEYHQFIHEEVKSWSYMKFPFLKALGSENGWYRVGPLARLNNCDFIATPLAETQRQAFFSEEGHIVQSTLAYHWARMIEALYCAEALASLLDDPDLQSSNLQAKGERREVGIGVIEAPRGTLIHHYHVDEQDLVTKANLIVSTTHNNTAMNNAVTQVAKKYLSGKELTPELLNAVEVAIRAYDPCLSCATHAVGQMPLILELVSAKNHEKISSLIRDENGQIHKQDS